MLVKNLVALCKLANKISNPSSLTSLFRSIQLGPKYCRVCSEFGNLEIELQESSGLVTERLLAIKDVMAVKEFPPNAEIFLHEFEDCLQYVCGNASGNWNYVVLRPDEKIPEINHETFPWTPAKELSSALLLAGSACQAAAVSVGLYGISIEVVGDKLFLMSCNQVALAAVSVDKGNFPVEKIVLRPPVPEIIAALISECPGVQLDVTDKGIYIKGEWLRGHLPLGRALDQDLKNIYDKWTTSAEHVTKIDSAAVKRFIKRAQILSDKHTSFTVGVQIKEGKLVLTHSGISSSSEEYFIADGIDPSVSFSSKQEVESGEERQGVALPAELVSLALSFVEEAIFDYLPLNTLALRGSNPSFLYVVGGGDERN